MSEEGAGGDRGEGDQHPAGCCNTSMYGRGVKAIGIPVKDIDETAGKVIQPEDVGLVVWEAVSKPERWG